MRSYLLQSEFADCKVIVFVRCFDEAFHAKVECRPQLSCIGDPALVLRILVCMDGANTQINCYAILCLWTALRDKLLVMLSCVLGQRQGTNYLLCYLVFGDSTKGQITCYAILCLFVSLHYRKVVFYLCGVC